MITIHTCFTVDEGEQQCLTDFSFQFPFVFEDIIDLTWAMMSPECRPYLPDLLSSRLCCRPSKTCLALFLFFKRGVGGLDLVQ